MDPFALEAGNGEEAAAVVFAVGDALGDALVRPGRVVVQLIDAHDIVVEVVDGAVSLTGTVPSQAQCAEAAAAARRVAGVTTVDTLLAVALPSGDFGDDAALAQLANQALAVNAAVPDGVKATAREGNVFLTGMVSLSAQRVAAEDTVAGVAGVLSITNEIEVQGNT